MWTFFLLLNPQILGIDDTIVRPTEECNKTSIWPEEYEGASKEV